MTDLVLSLRDGLFLKDGREWATAEEGRAHSLSWPMPSTLFGALVTARGRLDEDAGKDLAPQDWLALAASTKLEASLPLRRPLAASAPRWAAGHRVWPVPADALFMADGRGEPDRVKRLDPVPPRLGSLGRNDDAACEALWYPRVTDQEKPAPPPAWWPEAAFVEWLADRAVERSCDDAYRGLALPLHQQSHVGIDPETLAAREEVLFAHDVVEAIDCNRFEWAIGCRTVLGNGAPEHATIGGDRRLARIEIAGSDLFACPMELVAAFSGAPRGLRLVAVTPAAFERGWLPDGFAAAADGTYRGSLAGSTAELILRAALVPRAAHVSGWDMAAGRPKPTTRLVPPGAVYHFVRADGGPVTADIADRLWLSAIGERTEGGFGRFVPGVWHPAENCP